MSARDIEGRGAVLVSVQSSMPPSKPKTLFRSHAGWGRVRALALTEEQGATGATSHCVDCVSASTFKAMFCTAVL